MKFFPEKKAWVESFIATAVAPLKPLFAQLKPRIAPLLREEWLSRWVWVGIALLFTVSVWRTASSGHSDKKHSAIAPVPVRVVFSVQENFPIYLDGLGTVQAYNSVQVNARVSGQIQEIRFQEGQDVRQGDVLAVVDPRIYQAQYNQAVARKLQDQAQLDNARAMLGRNQKLLEKAVIDQQTYDTQRYLVAQLEATVLGDQANVESQKTQLDFTQITAPISGRAGVRQIDVGNLVTENRNAGSTNSASSIVVVNQIQPIFVSFTLPQQNFPQILEALGKNKNLSVLVLDRNNRTALSQGMLAVVDNQIDSTTATIRLKAAFENMDYKLWPGQFVNVRLLIGSFPEGVVVPAEAVQLGPHGSYVYTISTDQKALMRPVVTGPSEDGRTLITSGLKAGEKVVTEGQYRLQENTLVTIAPAAPPQSS